MAIDAISEVGLNIEAWLESEEVAWLQRDLEERILKALFSLDPESDVFQQVVAQLAWMGASEEQKVLLRHDIVQLDTFSEGVVSQCGLRKSCRKIGRFIATHKFQVLAGVALCATGIGLAYATGYGLSLSVGGIVLAGKDSVFSKDQKQTNEHNPRNLPPLSKSETEAILELRNSSIPKLDVPNLPDQLLVTKTGIWANGQFYSNDSLWKQSYLYGSSVQKDTFKSFSFQTPEEKALIGNYYNQAIQDLGKAIERNPKDPIPYLERGIAHFGLGEYEQSLQDYKQFTALSPVAESFSVTEFSLGVAKGLPRGLYESGKGLYHFVSDFACHPIRTSKQIVDSVSMLVDLARKDEWGVIGEALSPEVHQLVTQWDTLPSEKRGELAGYALGKHGGDILIPGALAKVAAKSAKSAQELAAICKNLQRAEEIFILETATEIGNSAKIGEAVRTGQIATFLGEELGFNVQEIGQLKQAGQLEKTASNIFENISKDPILRQSFEFFKKAEIFLEPYSKKFLPEAQIRELIHQTGVRTFSRPIGVPENYLVKVTEKGAGMIYMHPTNTHISIRVMPGKPHSSFPYQQKPYVIQMKEGKALDKFGNRVLADTPEAHIPFEEFVYKS